MKLLQKGVSCAELLQLIPEELVSNLEEETRVNYQVKKLSGVIILKLLLLTLLNSNRASLRIMEQVYQSEKFQTFSKKCHRKVKHSGIGNRIATVNYIFFQKIFESLYATFNPLVKTQSKFNLEIYDSTLVSLSAKLLESEMQLGSKGEKNQIKFTLSFDGQLPKEVKVFKEASALSEDVALRSAIFGSTHEKKSVVVFDRGLQKRKTFCELTENNILFVTRLRKRISYQEVKIFKHISGRATPTLKLQRDCIIKLKNENGKIIHQEFRLIVAESLATHELMLFLTNMLSFTAREITDIYKRRWEIEVFFKFIKQELNFSHLISRTENGIKVMLYATLILALLLIVFKEKNHLASYKIAKFRFANELDMEIVKEIIVSCGGDIRRYFGSKTLYPT